MDNYTLPVKGVTPTCCFLIAAAPDPHFMIATKYVEPLGHFPKKKKRTDSYLQLEMELEMVENSTGRWKIEILMGIVEPLSFSFHFHVDFHLETPPKAAPLTAALAFVGGFLATTFGPTNGCGPKGVGRGTVEPVEGDCGNSPHVHLHFCKSFSRWRAATFASFFLRPTWKNTHPQKPLSMAMLLNSSPIILQQKKKLPHKQKKVPYTGYITPAIGLIFPSRNIWFPLTCFGPKKTVRLQPSFVGKPSFPSWSQVTTWSHSTGFHSSAWKTSSRPCENLWPQEISTLQPLFAMKLCCKNQNGWIELFLNFRLGPGFKRK